jgi:glycosyltransferase involved in cell wall biosynthesis
LMSSRTEGLPVALIEASAAGVPAVCTNVGGINEIVAHERTGYLANEDDELAMHLDTILGDDTQRQLQSQRARMRVSERYTGAALASRLETHYLSIREERAAAQ